MSRTAIAAMLVVGIVLTLGGCPPGLPSGDGINLPPGDPGVGVATPQLSISASAVNVQQEPDPDSPSFDKTAKLTAVLVNFSGDPPEFAWSLEAGADAFLTFGPTDASRVLTATGEDVEVRAHTNPAGSQSFEVTLQATFGAETLTAVVSIVVRPNTSGVEVTVFSVNPFATPPMGVDKGQVVLKAGQSGPVFGSKDNLSFQWTLLSDLPGGVEVDGQPALRKRNDSTKEEVTLDEITLTVTGDVAAVLPFRVTVTDEGDNSVSGIVNVFLGVTNLDVDVRATRIDFVPVFTVALHTKRTGGVPPDAAAGADKTYKYTWKIFDEAGIDVTSTVTINPANETSPDAADNDWTVTGLSTPDAYVFQVTVDDPAGQSDQDSTNVTIGRDLALAVEPAHDQVGTSVNISLRTVRGGGEGRYTYTFEIFDQAGSSIDVSTLFTPASGTTSSALNNDWTLAGFATDGHYRIFASVTDASGNRVTASTGVTVGNTLGLAVEASRGHVGTGSGFSLRTSRTGGITPFIYSFRVLDQDGNTVNTNLGSATTDNAENDWAVSGFATAGHYRIFATVTDGVGRSVSASTAVTVGGLAGLDVQTAKLQFPPPSGGTTEDKLLRTVRVGGIGAFSAGVNGSYTFVVRDASGAVVSGFAFAVNAGSNGANHEIDWDVTIPAGLTPGTYRFFCTVKDSLSNEFTSSAEIDIVQPLGLDVQTAKVQFAPPVTNPTEDKLLRTVRVGGVGTFVANSYTFVVRDPSGADVTLFGTDFVFAVDGGSNEANPEIDWDVTIPNGLTAGTYRFFCTVTDSRGNQFTSSTEIDIVQPLGLDVQTAKLQFPPPVTNPTEDKLLRTVRVGGVGTFVANDYTFLVRDPSGADVTLFGTDFVFAVDGGSNEANPEIDWDVTIPNGLTAGTYRFFCTVKDSRRNEFTASAEILMVEPLGVDIQADVNLLGPRVPVRIRTNVTGGLAPYTKLLKAVDSQGDDPVGEFKNISAFVDTFAVPADGSGTYRISANVTDDFGNQVNDTVHLFVTSDKNLVVVDRIDNPPAAQPDLSAVVGFFEAGEPLLTGGSPMVFTPDVPAITNARNLTVLITDAALDDLTVASVVVLGTNQRDQAITETFLTPAIGSTVPFLFPFKTITNVTVTYSNEGPGDEDTIEIGIGTRFGVAGRFPISGDAAARQAFHIVAVGDDLVGNHKDVDVYLDPEDVALFNLGFLDGGANQQYIQFESPNNPDGVNDYIVQFGPG